MSKSKGSLLLSGASLVALISIAMVVPVTNENAVNAKAAATQSAATKKQADAKQTKSAKLPAIGLTPDEKVNVAVYEKAHRAVVNIAPLQTAEQVYFYGHDNQQEGIGSGVVISPEGHIVTNNHVIGDSEAVKVTFFDGTSLAARVIGVDPSNDLAVLKLQGESGKKFSYVEWGDSSNLQPGRRVFAIGNPFGLDHTMTAGIVSSLNRTFQTPNKRVIKGIIQTDAAINPGNSGGPLLDTQGKVVGITTAIMSRSGSSSGIGLAIPSNITKALVPELIAHGVVRRPDLGIMVLHPEAVRLQNGILAGLRVIQIDPKGPAQAAGLRVPRMVNFPIGKTGKGETLYLKQYDRSLADLIVAVDNIQIRNIDDLLSYIEKKTPGQVVNLTVLRNDPDKGPKIEKIPVKLAVTRTD